jgi:hypothetical protein
MSGDMSPRHPPLPQSRPPRALSDDATQTLVFDEDAVTRLLPSRRRPRGEPVLRCTDDDEITQPIPLVRRIYRR